MQVFLDEITFNHDQGSATNDAFNIRRNESELVNVPEWRRLVSVTPADSPAAYARDELTGNPTIQAKFSFDGFRPEVRKVRIRAVDPQKAQGVFQVFLRILGGVTGVKLKPNVLGSVVEREVALADAGLFQSFQLKDVRINTAGVSVSDVVWRWQFRTETTKWTNFETSTHRIYTVLKMPTEPWKPGPSISPTVQTPWTDVLDYACAWAARAQTIDEAANLITTAVHNLGTTGVLFYPIEYSGASGYVSEEPARFLCTDFLNLLRRQSNNNEPGVNCDDCAAIVGSFCNIVGHDLFQSKMQSDFGLNPHRRIGLAGVFGSRFSFHAAAWKDPCDEDSQLFDACVRVDSDSSPATNPHPWMVPRNIKFGRIGEHEYRFRLVKTDEEGSCVPVPSSKVRRIIGLSELGPVAPFPDVFREFVAKRHAFKIWNGNRQLEENLFIFNFFLGGNEFSNWRLDNLRLINQTHSAPIIQAFLRSKNFDKVNIRIDVHERRSLLDAHATVLKILSGFHLLDIVRQEHATYGDVVFSVPTNLVILFARGNLVFLLRNVGKGRAPCEPLAKAIDNLVISKPRTDHSGSLFTLESVGSDNGRSTKTLSSLEKNDRRQFKIFSSGEVSFENEQLVYQSKLDKQQPLEIFGIDAVGRIEKQLLMVESLKEHKHET